MDAEQPERLTVGPGTLALLGEAMFGAPLVGRLLDAYLRDRGRDPAARWVLVITGAEIVQAPPEPEQEQGEGAGAAVTAPAPEHTAENPS